MYRLHPCAGWVLPAVLAAGDPVPPPLLQLPAVQALFQKAHSPALKAAEARRNAAAQGIPQAGALPDPDLSLSVQRQPAAGVTLQSMEGEGGLMGLSAMLPARTEWGLMASQNLPWPGKRAAREAAARAVHAQAGSAVESARRIQEAELADTLLELLALRARRALLLEQDPQAAAAEQLARSRTELGRGTPADLLMTQQERSRLRQRLEGLDSREQDLLDSLSRAAGLAPGTPMELPEVSLATLPLPAPRSPESLLEELLARNPDWEAARTDEGAARAALTVAALDRRPDLRVGVGLMAMPGMAGGMGSPLGWKAEVGLALPLNRSRRQDRVVAQRQAEITEVQAGREALRLLLAQRARERARALSLGLRAAERVRLDLLPAGEAALASLIAGVETGRVELPRVMEALKGLLSDREALLDLTVGLHRLSLQQHRASLEAPPAFDLAMGAAPMTASPSPTPRAAAGARSGQPAVADTAAPMKM